MTPPGVPNIMLTVPATTSVVACARPLYGMCINFTPAALYLGKATGAEAAKLLALQAGWTFALLALGQWAWQRSQQRITIQGG